MEGPVAKFILSITASLLLLWAGESLAASTTIKGGTGSTTAAVTSGSLHVTITGGAGSGGTSQSDNAALSAVTPIGALYDTTPPAITDGNVGIPVMDSSRRLLINCGSGCSGGTQYDQGTVATATDALSMLGCRRVDTAAVDAGVAAGDRSNCIVSANGSLWIANTNMESYLSRLLSSALTSPSGGAAAATTGFIVGGRYLSTPPTLTNGQEVGLMFDSAGALKVSGAGGGTQYAEDIAHTTGDQMTMAGAVRRDTAAAGSGTDGDISTINVDATGRMWTNTELPDAAALADNTSNPTVPGVGSFNMCWDGTNWDRCPTGTGGNGTVDANTQRVTIASDSTGTVIATSATAANFLNRPDTSGATGAAPPARANFVGGLGSGATGGFVIGVPVADTFKSVSVTSGTTTLLVTGVSGRHVRISSINLVTAIANNVALISGTGATCGTGTAGISGGTTAANGWNFAANGGLSLGNGLGTVMQTAAAGDSVCVITSAAGPLAGSLSYAIY